MDEHVVKDYMSGNTRIIIKDNYIVSEYENDQIYNRLSVLFKNAFLRIQKEKDTHAVGS